MRSSGVGAQVRGQHAQSQPRARWQTRRVLVHAVLLTACACMLVVSATQAVVFARRGELNGVRAWMVGMLALSATFTGTGQIIDLYE